MSDTNERSVASAGSLADFGALVDRVVERVNSIDADRRLTVKQLHEMESKVTHALVCCCDVQSKGPLSLTVPVGDSGEPEMEILTAVIYLMNRLGSSIRNDEESRVAARRIARYVYERWGG